MVVSMRRQTCFRLVDLVHRYLENNGLLKWYSFVGGMLSFNNKVYDVLAVVLLSGTLSMCVIVRVIGYPYVVLVTKFGLLFTSKASSHAPKRRTGKDAYLILTAKLVKYM